ncbi:Flp pilus assembly protein CpaB [Paraburkholderia hospita]|jgi:pilus assembly protein CpaB|uniref:Flp pilus assembly protein CpaB n=1 Tax=Paraburkholderia hospita TaxID=169430 RepID=A0AAN1MJC8_9BURK|nr:Flp pilus assembly protein CpaB [Paraburkholderia hospita]AUT69236.1 Flp pilus assembly protein CpaB [Paraburkholderia hospita]SEI16571.1 pilus assembly protein CpaB [Paraburkholderia hospita]
MKNVRALVMLLVAAVAGLVGVAMASRWLLDRSSGMTEKIAVSAVDISLGQRLNPEFIKMVDWPSGSLPPGSFTSADKLDGRVLKTSALRGEPILEGKLSPVGTMGGLSAVIAEGRRAITVRVNDVIGVAGFALPGNYVDIIVSTQQDKGNDKGPTKDESISKIVLEKILVLAVAQEVGRDETKPKVVNAVTLEVTPEQAEKLDLARSVGTLSLVLRNQVDTATLPTGGATKFTLLGASAPAPASAPAAAPVRPVRAHYVARPAAPRDCIGVLSGVLGSVECF